MAKTYSAGGVARGAKYWRLTIDVRESDGERRRPTKTTKIACAKNGTRGRSAALPALRQWRGEICPCVGRTGMRTGRRSLSATRSRRAKTAASSFATTRKTPPGEAPSETSPCPRRWRPPSPAPSAPRWTGSATSTARSTSWPPASAYLLVPCPCLLHSGVPFGNTPLGPSATSTIVLSADPGIERTRRGQSEAQVSHHLPDRRGVSRRLLASALG